MEQPTPKEDLVRRVSVRARIPWSAADRMSVGTLQAIDAAFGELQAELDARTAELDRANLDSLTGLPRREHGLEELRRAVATTRRAGSDLTLVMVDLDGFKSANDTFGHTVGDSLIRAFGQVLRITKRESDVAIRWGGDEFLLGLVNTDVDGAQRVSSRLEGEFHQHLRQSHPELAGKVRVGVSLGCAEVDAKTSTREAIHSAIEKADDLMYAQKQSRKAAVVDL